MTIMRGADRQTAKLFSYISPDGLVPQGHPLRAIRPLVNAALERLSGDFDAIYSSICRDSIAPEKLLAGPCCCKRSSLCVRSAN